uniref:Retrotransposon gag domain-containing protein n=1 Tax=Tanacetum cinerariifolium TaxID=118510 RepID=A0A6L2JEB4_TANCI|nr:hypothetical protein [Tanacetum cinerariifolium]
MGVANPICTLGDYSKASHEGYMNTIELTVGNQVVPLQPDTIRERTHLRLFQFSLCDQARNWLERLIEGPITTWEELTTHFLAQFFPPRRTTKLRNDILMFQQHHGESISEAWTLFKDLLQNGKLRDKNADESWEIIENLALYDNEGRNDSKEFFKLGSRSTPRPSLTHVPQAYVEAVYSNPRPQNQNEPPKQNPFTFHKRKVERNDNDDMAADGGINGIDVEMSLKEAVKETEVMPFSTYMKLTDERPAETDIRLSLASHSYIYPLAITDDVLVNVAGYVYPMDFVILIIKEDEKRPFILGTPFLMMAKAVIKFDKGTINLRSRKSKISFHMKPEPLSKVKKEIKKDVEPIAPTMTVNRLVLEWEEKETEFDQWRSKNFNNKHPALIKVEGEMKEGEVT